ncbi:MAG TPA: ATP-binding cassette domain-containing protein [Pyrinomonadaceae bacterium]|nr:ATP-binding cassette domain-containing protein [Pyrinomonadaceae bacterium]
MAIKIEPFSISSNEEEVTRSIPEIVLDRPEVIQFSGSNWPLTQAIVFAAFGFDLRLVLSLGYKIRQGPDPEAPRKSLKLSYASSFPHAEISLFWETVKEEITLGDLRLTNYPLFGTIVEMLCLSPLLERRPDQLSGGETAKVILAAHLVKRPDVLIVDRGLGEIDVHTRFRIINYIRTVSNNNLLVVLDNAQIEGINIYFDTDKDPVVATGPPATSAINPHSLFNYTQLAIVPSGSRCGISKDYLLVDDFAMERNGQTLFEGVFLKATSGSLLWVLGPNGSGKTSFFEALLNLSQTKTGRAFWSEAGSLENLDKHIAYSPQDPDIDATELTLLEEVTLAYGERSSEGTIKRLKEIGLPDESLRLPLSEDLSLKKLASVLAALNRRKNVCLLDEPTLFISDAQRSWVIKAMCVFLSEGGVILCATHDSVLFESFERSGQ